MVLEGYKYIVQIVVIAELFLILILYRSNPRLAFYITILSIVLKGQYIWVGRPLYAWQASALIGLWFLLIGSERFAAIQASQSLRSFNRSINLYFLYTFIVSILMWTVFSIEGLGTSLTEVSLSRIATQTVYFLFVIGLYAFGKRAARYLTTVDLVRALVIIATVVAYSGLLQAAVMRTTGINLFPIIGSDGSLNSAFILDKTFRMNSFAGEPKHMGILMSIGLTSFYLSRLFRIRIGGRFSFHMPVAMISALFASLSTTGMFLTGIGIGISSIMFFRRIRVSDLWIISIVIFSVSISIYLSDADVLSSLEAQLSKNNFEVQDQSIISALQTQPWLAIVGTGLGNIHLIAADYLPENFPLFRDAGYKGNSGLLFVIGDSGLIGLLLLVIMPLYGFTAYMRERRRFNLERRVDSELALALLIVMLFSFLLRYDVLYFLLCGFVFSRLVMFHRNPFEHQLTFNQHTAMPRHRSPLSVGR